MQAQSGVFVVSGWGCLHSVLPDMEHPMHEPAPFTEVFYRPGAGDDASAGAAVTSPYSTLCQSKCEEQLSGYENESGRIGSWANRG